MARNNWMARKKEANWRIGFRREREIGFLCMVGEQDGEEGFEPGCGFSVGTARSIYDRYNNQALFTIDR
jgi:hypothetical protein